MKKFIALTTATKTIFTAYTSALNIGSFNSENEISPEERKITS